jgi:hypothetical protein
VLQCCSVAVLQCCKCARQDLSISGKQIGGDSGLGANFVILGAISYNLIIILVAFACCPGAGLELHAWSSEWGGP